MKITPLGSFTQVAEAGIFNAWWLLYSPVQEENTATVVAADLAGKSDTCSVWDAFPPPLYSLLTKGEAKMPPEHRSPTPG